MWVLFLLWEEKHSLLPAHGSLPRKWSPQHQCPPPATSRCLTSIQIWPPSLSTSEAQGWLLSLPRKLLFINWNGRKRHTYSQKETPNIFMCIHQRDKWNKSCSWCQIKLAQIENLASVWLGQRWHMGPARFVCLPVWMEALESSSRENSAPSCTYRRNTHEKNKLCASCFPITALHIIVRVDKSSGVAREPPKAKVAPLGHRAGGFKGTKKGQRKEKRQCYSASALRHLMAWYLWFFTYPS